MVSKDPKKRSITEEDTAILLQRYTATTVLALLQEVAQLREVNIDWNRLVAKSSTGIFNVREYQMLWRHLAYREPLVEKFDNGAQPLDDDSDLEYEVVAAPAVSGEDLTDAAACVKVLIASGSPNDSSHQNSGTVEGPSTIKIPNGQSSRSHQNSQPTCSMQGMKITVPVSVKKQTLPPAATSAVATAEGGDANGLATNSTGSRKRRKKWSEAEDLELIAAVRKHGEGNWAHILRGDFKGDRTPGQLSQRWKNIRKQNRDLNVGGSTCSKLSEAQLATRHAMSIALNMPNITANTIGTAGTSTHSKFAGTNATSNSVLTTAAEAKPQSQQGLNLAKRHQMGLLGSTTKSPVISKKTLPKPNSNNDGMVRATAVAAGARIACPSDAASLLKAAQAKNAVHVIPTVASSTQLSLPGGMSSHSEPQPNVHYMRTSLSTTPVSTSLPTAVTPTAVHPGSSKVLPQTSQHTPTNGTSLSKQISGVGCLDKDCAPTEHPQDGAVISRNGQDDQVQEDKVVEPPDQKDESKNLLSNAPESAVGSLNNAKDETVDEDIIDVKPNLT